MTAVLLGAAWAVVVAGGLSGGRPRSARLDQLRAVVDAPEGTYTSTHRRRVGRAVVAFIVPVAVIPLPVGGALGVGAAAAAWYQPIIEARRTARRRLARLETELPDVVDLLVLAVGAGLTVPLALDAVARRGAGELAEELGRVVAASHQGHRLADALDALPDRTGEAVRPLVAALVASERYGAPLAAGLDRLASEIRATRRRRASEAAQRVSVKLLFPLVLCILPAFALLTVAPLIASALKSLRL